MNRTSIVIPYKANPRFLKGKQEKASIVLRHLTEEPQTAKELDDKCNLGNTVIRTTLGWMTGQKLVSPGRNKKGTLVYSRYN